MVPVTEFIVRALRDQGVGTLFVGLGGLNDAFMPAFTGTEGVRTVVAAFEGGGAYMADGYARATGGLGACFGIGGPGVLNMTTALAAARTDRSPVLAISGEVPRSWEGRGGFQDASAAALDDVDVLERVTGLSLSIAAPGLVPHHLRRAVTEALARRTPTHLSIPTDVQAGSIGEVWRPVPDALTRPDAIDLPAFDRLAANGDRPIVVLAGPGVLHAGGTDALRAFAERFDVPVATTLSGKGTIAETHPLALGVFGYGGSRLAIDTIRSGEVAVLIVIGSALSQRDTMQWDPRMLPSQALVHVDWDPLVIGSTWPSDVPLVGNPAGVLARLADAADLPALEAGRAARRAFLDRMRAAGPRRYNEEDTASEARPMHPARVVAELRASFPDEGALCVDSGAHRAWFAEYWDVRMPRTHYSLANLGPMGGAIPLGIGVAMGRPGHPVMVATGDGCMLMHGMEIHTAVRERLPLVVAVMNNHAYGNIYYRAARMGAGPERLTEIAGIDWVGFARSMGADGARVEDPGEIGPAVERAVAAGGPFLLDLVVDKTYPTPVGAWRDRVKEWEDND